MKVCVEALTGLVVYTIQTVPTTRCSLEAAPLKMTPTVGAVGRVYILRTGGVRSLRWPRSSPQVGWQSHPLDDPPHPTLPPPQAWSVERGACSVPSPKPLLPLWVGVSKRAQREAEDLPPPVQSSPGMGSRHSLPSMAVEGTRKQCLPQQGLGAPQPGHLALTFPRLRNRQRRAPRKPPCSPH